MNIELKKQLRLLTKNKVCREDIDIIPVLQQKTVTESGIVVPDSGYVGLSRVDVSMPAVSGGVLDNLDNPTMPKLGRLKYFDSSRSMVRYKECYPTASSFLEGGTHITSGTFTAESKAAAVGVIYGQNNAPVDIAAEMKRLVVGEKAYDAYYYVNDLAVLWSAISGGVNKAAKVSGKYIPPCICRVAHYNSRDGKIETLDVAISGTDLPEENAAAVSGMYSVAMHGIDITVGMLGVSTVLGVEFVYEKYDITLSGSKSNLQYSTDDGVTFADVTNGLTLDQVEHVVFRNESTGTVKIGSTAGASDYASIPAGATMAVAALAGGTWYVS